ncbi:MAG: VCBS repeat-containing protein [Verrucomicrobia bacterium]|nr:VCBS repeat-containing protein [Verrucomicrobiota bacterium]
MKLLLLPALAASLLAARAADLPEPRFRAVNVDTNIAIGYGLAIADVDGDRKPDILLADKTQIVWYRNPGWEKFVMADKLTDLDHVCIAAADVDGDGKAEVAVGAGWNPGDTVNSGALFYLIPPADRTQRWEPVALPHEPTVHRILWVPDWQGRMTLISVPLHGRGNNAGKGEGAGVKIQRYRPPANPRDPWEVTTLDESLHKTHNFDPVEWDDDPARELLVGAKEGVFVSNWSRDTQRNELVRIAGDAGGGAGEVRMGRLGSDRFVASIEPMHGNALVLHRPAPAGGTNLWTRTVLDESLVDGHALVTGDFLGLGRDQIVVGWRAMNRPGVPVGVRLYIPTDAAGSGWRPVLLDDNGMACEDLKAADLDGDGRLDLIAAGRGTRNVKVYWNLPGR